MIGDWIDKVEYPQLPAMTEKELLEFFESAEFARLGTINEDSTIHIAPIFFMFNAGQILMATQERSRKIRNIKRNNNVSVLIDTTEVPFKGALVYGTVELDYEISEHHSPYTPYQSLAPNRAVIFADLLSANLATKRSQD